MIVLGNDQDSYGGGFTLGESFHGNVTNVNIWDRVLVGENMSALTKSCLVGEGNALKWSQLTDKRPQEVDLICKLDCV